MKQKGIGSCRLALQLRIGQNLAGVEWYDSGAVRLVKELTCHLKASQVDYWRNDPVGKKMTMDIPSSRGFLNPGEM